jgi:hypothetical protein
MVSILSMKVCTELSREPESLGGIDSEGIVRSISCSCTSIEYAMIYYNTMSASISYCLEEISIVREEIDNINLVITSISHHIESETHIESLLRSLSSKISSKQYDSKFDNMIRICSYFFHYFLMEQWNLRNTAIVVLTIDITLSRDISKK